LVTKFFARLSPHAWPEPRWVLPERTDHPVLRSVPIEERQGHPVALTEVSTLGVAQGDPLAGVGRRVAWSLPAHACDVAVCRAEGRQNVHRGDKPWPPAGPWRGPEAGAAGNSEAKTNREPPRKCLWRRVAGVRYDA